MDVFQMRGMTDSVMVSVLTQQGWAPEPGTSLISLQGWAGGSVGETSLAGAGLINGTRVSKTGYLLLDNISAGSSRAGALGEYQDSSSVIHSGTKAICDLLQRQTCWRSTPCSQHSPRSVPLPFLTEIFASA